MTPKLQAARAECERHAAVLLAALEALQEAPPGEEDEAASERLRVLDQLAYRFGKLQDTLGERVLPGVLDLLEEPLPPSTPFAQKLQRLERLGVIPGAEQWRRLREVRHAIAHEYPETPAVQAALVRRFVAAVTELLNVWISVEVYLGEGEEAPA
ncbi:MAG: hypothetical protein VKQ33_10060 [Candidatus Sericytochromatia bacterium]|nr:hypothetical protein [Candidatus Sericytochromatia bacterium]